MKSLWICVIPTIVICVGLLIAVIALVVKPTKTKVVIGVVLSIFTVFLMVLCIPYFRDMSDKKTLTYEATFTGREFTGLIACSTLKFSVGGKTIEVNASMLEYSNYNLSTNRKYRVTFYNHSNTLKSIELIKE